MTGRQGSAPAGHGRWHNYWVVRHLAAFFVLFAHSFELSGKLPMDLLRAFPLLVGISGLGVTLFFIVSGFLVTQSWQRHQSAAVFGWHRLLRIMPGLVGCIAFAVLLGWALGTLPTAAYWSHPQLREYVLGNVLMRNVLVLPGLFQGNPAGPGVTGTFWTLPLELTCYLWVLVLGVLGLLGRRGVATAVLLAALAGVTLWGGAINVFGAAIIPQWLPRYYAAFLCGMLLALWRERVFIGWWLPGALMAAAGAAWWYMPAESALRPWMDLVYVAMLAWFLVNAVAAASRWWPEPAGWPDLSYGVYLYGFPIQQALVHWRPDWNGWMVFGAASALSLLAAAASWYAIEARALRLKDALGRGGHPGALAVKA